MSLNGNFKIKLPCIFEPSESKGVLTDKFVKREQQNSSVFRIIRRRKTV